MSMGPGRRALEAPTPALLDQQTDKRGGGEGREQRAGGMAWTRR